MFYVVPYLLINFVRSIQSHLDHPFINNISALYLILVNIVGSFFHLFNYIDLVNITSRHNKKSLTKISAIDGLSLALTISIYQIVIFGTTHLINMIFHEKIYLLSFLINFVILTIYHSFYYYNNLWHYKKIEIMYRIDMHEKIWPYYIGYGTISTLIYLTGSTMISIATYNIYMIIALSNPFLTEIKYPSTTIKYPAINLYIFGYLTDKLMYIIGKIIGSKNK